MNFIQFKQTDGTLGIVNIYAIESVLEDGKGRANIYCFGHGQNYFYETLSTLSEIMDQILKHKRLDIASIIAGGLHERYSDCEIIEYSENLIIKNEVRK
jgi:hypothetical protein